MAIEIETAGSGYTNMRRADLPFNNENLSDSELVANFIRDRFDYELIDSGPDHIDSIAYSLEPQILVRDEPEVSERVVNTLSIYNREISQRPLLTAAEEVTLAKAIETGRSASEILEDGAMREIEEQNELIKLISEGIEAKNTMIEANLRLVESVARRYVGRGLDLLDLIQEGNIGLSRSVDKFDHKRGFKFSTYAYWWIRQAVTRAIADQSRTVRIPVHMVDLIRKVWRTTNEIQLRIGGEPSIEEIADEMGLKPERVRDIIKAGLHPRSLDDHVTTDGEEDDAVLADFIPDLNAVSPLGTAEQNATRNAIEQALDVLTERERNLIIMRFGFDGKGERTLDDISLELGVTRERVRQIEVLALAKLRNPVNGLQLKEYLD